MIPFNMAVLRDLFNSMETDIVESVAKKAGEMTGPEEIVFVFNKVNPETVRRYIELRGSQLTAYHHWEENDRHHYVLQHDLGSNFTVYVKSFLESMLKVTLGKTIRFSALSPNSLTFSIYN